jgi:hypothetical protein
MNIIDNHHPVTKEEFLAYILPSVGGMERFVGFYVCRAHTPKKRAESSLQCFYDVYYEVVRQFQSLDIDPDLFNQWFSGLEKKWLAKEMAGSRTVNWMITDPANFPTERNDKRNQIEMKRIDEYLFYINDVQNWINKYFKKVARMSTSLEAKDGEYTTKEFADVRMVVNTGLDRIQLVFQGKPDEKSREYLKKLAFRWSPTEAA